jgi:phenylacetate-CoA ligase
MTAHYDDLETRGADERAASLAECLPAQVGAAQALPGYREALDGYDPAEITTREALARLPVLRKSALTQAQTPGNRWAATPAPVTDFAHVFQSPGPIYEPGQVSHDWWRVGRFLHAAGVGAGDIVQNCFGYHLTPAGMIFESGARAVGATVLPAGTGQTELQARAARDVGCTAYAGTPDFLKVILDKAGRWAFAEDLEGGRFGRGAVPVAAQGICRPGDRHAAMLCHRRSGPHRL